MFYIVSVFFVVIVLSAWDKFRIIYIILYTLW